jgi:hypothetical protein
LLGARDYSLRFSVRKPRFVEISSLNNLDIINTSTQEDKKIKTGIFIIERRNFEAIVARIETATASPSPNPRGNKK